jgi:hypothetical protein
MDTQSGATTLTYEPPKIAARHVIVANAINSGSNTQPN